MCLEVFSSLFDSVLTCIYYIAVYVNEWTVGELLTPTELSNTLQYQQLLWRRVREGQRMIREKPQHQQLLLLQQLQQSQEENNQLQQQLRQVQQESREEIHQLQQQSQQELRQVHQQSQEEVRQLQEEVRQLRIQQDHWVVTKGDITMTQEVLGKGGWAEVRVAKFRGLRVAAKCLHDIILSDYNIQYFIREMEIAARIRHPNLLQFIGATREGSPIILSELMPTSLRKQLEKAPLPHTHILCISVGVATALNYLHLWRPSPIIHRDVSSSNVLLEPSADGSWKAKLSDYGSANLLQQISPTSVNPGSPAYSAPEAQVPVHHSPAMDVYSYGVLLTEMVLRRLPGFTVEERQQFALSIKWPSFKDVVTRCIATDRQSRPSIADVLQQLEQMKV